MLIPMACKNCLRLSFLRISDRGLYYLKCVNCGEENNIILQQQHFEVLADIGMQAIMDGYTREAVTSFTASHERFMEFYIRVVARHRQIGDDVCRDTWKLVQSQSERQLGMFFGCYMMENGKSPPTIPRQQVQFRNKVVHNGYIPEEQESIKYGQEIINIVQAVIWDMRSRYKSELSRVTHDHVAAAFDELRNREGITIACHSMVYHVMSGEAPEVPNLQELMAQRREAIRRWTAGPAAT